MQGPTLDRVDHERGLKRKTEALDRDDLESAIVAAWARVDEWLSRRRDPAETER